MAHEVFISYAAEDIVAAKAICTALESNGIKCWYAKRDVDVGKVWYETVPPAIDKCRLLVFVSSYHSNKSPPVKREIERASGKGIPILTIRIDDEPIEPSLEFLIGVRQWLDAQVPPLEAHLSQLVKTARQIITQQIEAEKRQEAERQKLEEANRIREAALQAKKETEEALKEGKRRESEKAKQGTKEKKSNKAKIAWISASFGIMALIVIGIVVFTPKTVKTPPTTTPPVTTSAATIPLTTTPLTTTPPTTTPPTTTPPTTTPPTTISSLPPNEYVKIDFAPTTFDKKVVNWKETFNVFLSGNLTCLKDIPYPVSGLIIIPKITAKNLSSGAELPLIVSNNITSESIPVKQGETASFLQTLQLQFLGGTVAGDYVIFLYTDKIKVNIGLWVDIDEFFQLKEQYLGTVTYNSQ